MKTFLSILLLLFINGLVSQNVESYTVTPALSIGANTTKASTMPVSSTHSAINSTWGLYRVRINISTGSSSYNDKEKISVDLKSPDGNILTLTTTSVGLTGKRHYLDTWFRDDAPMTIATMLGIATPAGQSNYNNTCSSWIPFGGSLNTKFNNGQNPTGTWSLSITTGALNTNITLNSWELEFRDTPGGSKTTSAWVTNSDAAYTAYDVCSTPKKMDKYHNYYGRTRLTYSGDATTDPDIAATAGKPWRIGASNMNGTLDNTIWYTFKTDATGGNVNVLFSYINRNAGYGYQAVVVDAGASPCVAANWSRVSGAAFSGLNITDIGGASVGTTIVFNSVINCTGLSANKIYYICIDGQGNGGTPGPYSDVEFQIEVTGNVLENYITLPIELLYFKGEHTNNYNILKWATATEINNAYFELEKSNDGISFKNIATINSQANNGNSRNTLLYEYNTDLETAYYRLKQVDIDGSFKYLNTVYLENAHEANNPLVMPNPASHTIQIKYTSKVNTPTTISLVDVAGREILSQQALFNAENQSMSLNIEYVEQGLYFLNINNSYKSFQYKIIKQ